MEDTLAAVRRFNRFYTKLVGALDANFLESGMSLAEARLLFEIRHGEPCYADGLQSTLDLDAGFTSRVLRRFEERGWIVRAKADRDGRRRSIRLTEAGRARFDRLDARQRDEVAAMLGQLQRQDRQRLAQALGTVEALLGEGADPAAFAIRTFRPGDMGLIVSRQAILYHEHYGFNAGIEANEAEVTSAFLRNFKPGREQCWVAEVDGVMAGSIILTDEGDGLCRLRLLYVEPDFQGRGIGDALVTTCIAFARSVGYARMTLWTQSILESARRIYARHGFAIVSTEAHASFGPILTGEIWMLDLAA